MCDKCICKHCPTIHICNMCLKCSTTVTTCSVYASIFQYNCGYCGTVTTEKICPTCGHIKGE